MKINFAKVPSTDIQYFDTDTLFSDGNDYYYFTLEYGTNPGGLDEVAINDGCNRVMPIAIENIPDLITALTEVYTFAKEIEAGKEQLEWALSDATGSVVAKNTLVYNTNHMKD